jgi:hypothetical protein
MTTKNVARNRKKFIDGIFAKATDCIMNNRYARIRNQPCSASDVAKDYWGYEHARLQDKGNGEFMVCIDISCNVWYYFKVNG